ncbi:MAG: prolyl oligopeptidase family serine peptidase [Candidatus Rhabdochlamydia sp.]
MKHTSSYGLWPSCLHASHLAAGQKRIGMPLLHKQSIYWDEALPDQKGRTALMEKTAEGALIEHTPSSMSCRSRVNEYGGQSFAISCHKVYFVNDHDQRIYEDGSALTEPGLRCADFTVHEDFLIGVAEKENDQFLFCLHTPSKTFNIIASGHDFYASPTLSPCKTKIAYLTWNHPHMPWEESQLWLGEWKEGVIHSACPIAGGKGICIQQPQWSPEGILHCISDESNWWNLYRYEQGTWTPIHPCAQEFGLPLWQLGLSTYTFCDQHLIATFQQDGVFTLLNVTTQEVIPLPYTFYTQLKGEGNSLVFIGASHSRGKALVHYNLFTQQAEVITQEQSVRLDPEMISFPQFLSFPSADDRICHAIYYPPHHNAYEAPQAARPPLIVISHGGPTSQAFAILDLKIQFWTSRGFAVIDVNYAGSSGYGRAYRSSLQGQWGVFDVQDCEAAATFLTRLNLVNPLQIAIRGSSAGGYTTLKALTSSDVFTVGASYYGVCDLLLLAQETHKFEAHYLDQLIGPFPSSQKLYEERSPLHHSQAIKCPVIFFQGKQDRIVPPNQTQLMHNALKQQGIKTDLILYPDEQHGFRNAKNIQDALNQELSFYLAVWNIV